MVNAVAEGARGVRFSEVELYRVRGDAAGTPADAHQTLVSADEMLPYDAVVVAVTAGGSLDPELGRFLEDATHATPRTAWKNKVASAFPSEPSEHPTDLWPSLATLGNMGMLVVSPSAATMDAAKELGARIAQVVSWVTHARSHHHHAH